MSFRLTGNGLWPDNIRVGRVLPVISKHLFAVCALVLLLGASCAHAEEAADAPVPEGDGSNLRPKMEPIPSPDGKEAEERSLVQPDDLPGSAIPHLTTNDFLQKVGRAEMPVLVQFDAKWCPYCKKLQPALDKLRQEKLNSIDMYKVDADADPDLMRSYEVGSLPTLIMFYDGRIVGRSDGSIDEKELYDWVDAVETDLKSEISRKKKAASTPL